MEKYIRLYRDHTHRDYAATTPNVCIPERTSKQTESFSRMPSLQLFGRKSLPCHVQLPRLAQDLYKSRHNGLLIHLHRAILDKNGIPPDNSKFSKPELCIEKENVKILWDTPLQLPYALSNGANKPDITEIDHEQKLIILYEGTVCRAGKRHQKWREKQNKYAECRAGLLNL